MLARGSRKTIRESVLLRPAVSRLNESHKGELMFETLDEQIKEQLAEDVPSRTTALRYALIGIVTVLIFSGLYAAMMWMDY